MTYEDKTSYDSTPPCMREGFTWSGSIKVEWLIWSAVTHLKCRDSSMSESFMCDVTQSEWRDSFICDMTHPYVTWLIRMWHGSPKYDMTHPNMRHDSFIRDLIHSYLTWLIDMQHDSFMNFSTGSEWAMCQHMNESPTWMSDIYDAQSCSKYLAGLGDQLLEGLCLKELSDRFVAWASAIMVSAFFCRSRSAWCVLQCVAVGCSVMQYVAVCCRVLQCDAVRYCVSMVQRVAVSPVAVALFTHVTTPVNIQ